jgi:acid phosphatase (class A)
MKHLLAPALSAMLLLSSAGAGQQAAPSAAEAALAKLPPGFLPHDQLPDSLALLPPPPARDSAAFQRDEAARRDARRFRGTARWRLATSDADLSFPHAAATFSCAAGVAISKEATPRTYALLGRSLIDIGLSTYGAKNRYKRTRPFVMHPAGTCSPKDEAILRTDGSYPSGHSAAGWGWALILAELVPDRSNAILQRGRDFGQNRIVCGVHWQSDVDAGRVISAAAVARLHGDLKFREELDAARQELAAARVAARPGATTCAAEAAALATP